MQHQMKPNVVEENMATLRDIMNAREELARCNEAQYKALQNYNKVVSDWLHAQGTPDGFPQQEAYVVDGNVVIVEEEWWEIPEYERHKALRFYPVSQEVNSTTTSTEE